MLQLPSSDFSPKSDRSSLEQQITEALRVALQSLEIAVEVSLNDGCLTVNLASDAVLDQARLVTIVRMELAALGVESITRVKVYGWRRDEELPEQLPAWNQTFVMDPPVKSSKKKQSESPIIKLPVSERHRDELAASPIRRPDVPAESLDLETSEATEQPEITEPLPEELATANSKLQPKSALGQKQIAPLVFVGLCIVVVGLGLGVAIGRAQLKSESLNSSASSTESSVSSDRQAETSSSNKASSTSTKDTSSISADKQPDAVSNNSTDKSGDSKITLAKFNLIQKGMTIKQVQEIIGSPGKLIANSKLGDVTGQVYSWKNAEGSNAIVEFKNGEVVAKAQAGL